MHTLWILLLPALFSLSSCHSRHLHRLHGKSLEHCYSPHELQELSDKVVEGLVGTKIDWKRYTAVSLVKDLEDAEKRRKRRKRSDQSSCNFETISKGQNHSQRSISPWSYSINVDENRYPQKLAFAKCLCKHCINVSTGKETSALNSVTLHQSMMVLRKEPCPGDSSKVTFRIHYEHVPVACTCVLPRYL